MSFKIELVNKNKDITRQLNSRLISLALTDNSSNETDVLELIFDNHNFQIEAPPEGTKLKLWLDDIFCGQFVTDEVKISIKPNTLSVSAKSTDFTSVLKQKRDRNFSEKTLLQIMQEIADSAGMSAKVHAELKNYFFYYLMQNNESDLNFLSRLARDANAVFKINGRNLIFTKQGESVSGSQLETTTLNAFTDIASGDFTRNNRNDYKSVVAFFKTPEMDKKQHFRVGTEKPVFIIKEVQTSEQLAEKIAKAKLAQLTASGVFANIKTTRRLAKIKAGSKVVITNLNKFNGTYLVEKVKHELGVNNYSSLELKII